MIALCIGLTIALKALSHLMRSRFVFPFEKHMHHDASRCKILITIDRWDSTLYVQRRHIHVQFCPIVRSDGSRLNLTLNALTMGYLEKILDLLNEIRTTSPLVLPVVGFVVFVFLLRLYLNLPLPAPSIEVGEPKGGFIFYTCRLIDCISLKTSQ